MAKKAAKAKATQQAAPEASEASTAVLDAPDKPNKVLFAVSCTYGRGGFGKDSGSVGVRFGAEVLTPKNRVHFIQSTLLVTMSLNPYPPGQGTVQLPGTEEEYSERTMQVTCRRISLGGADMSVTLKFDKNAMDPEFLASLAGQSGSMIVHEIVSGDSA